MGMTAHDDIVWSLTGVFHTGPGEECSHAEHPPTFDAKVSGKHPRDRHGHQLMLLFEYAVGEGLDGVVV